MIAKKLKVGDKIRVVAPARSLSIISQETRQIATQNFKNLGLEVSFSKHVEEIDDFYSSSITSRVEDLHEAFLDKSVKAIFTSIGGFSSNQILDYLDWNLIKANPKILCGFSDITALNHAIYHKTGLVTYQGPHFSSLGMKKGLEYTISYLKKCLFEESPFTVKPSPYFSDDPWFADQENRNFKEHKKIKVFHPGTAEGKIIGGNLCTLNLLQGTPFMPSLENSILFVEDDDMSDPQTLDRDLQSLIHQKGFSGVKAIVFGMFQKKTNLTEELLSQIIKSKEKLKDLVVVANFDFGHTTPRITFPVGGIAKIDGKKLTIIKH